MTDEYYCDKCGLMHESTTAHPKTIECKYRQQRIADCRRGAELFVIYGNKDDVVQAFEKELEVER